MNRFNHKILLFFLLAFVSLQHQTLYAVKREIEDSDQLLEVKKVRLTESLQDILRKTKNGHYISEISLDNLRNNDLEEIKQFDSTILFDDEIFDDWITLTLRVFLKNSYFDRNLKVAKERGESDQASPAAQYNLGLMYCLGKGVDQNPLKSFQFYKKAAIQGHAASQNNVGAMYYQGRVVVRNLSKAVKWYKRASEQDYTIAQFNLAFIYHKGQGIHRDLLQSLKWYLKSGKNKEKRFNLKNLIERIVTFVPISLTPEEEIQHLNNQQTLKSNIEVLIGLFEMEKGINNSKSSFKESKFAVPSLVKNYQEMISFEEVLLKIINAYQQPGFMITCLKPKKIYRFKSSDCPDIKYYEVQGQSFLIFGQDNIGILDKWMSIFDTTHPVYSTISDILDVLIKIQKNSQKDIEMNDLAKDLKKQYHSRLKLNSKNQPSDLVKLLPCHKGLIEKVEQQIKLLKHLQTIPQQLEDLLIEGVPVRNKLFLQNNQHIEPIFQD